MMDTIYEMIGWVKYLTTISDTFERYNTNSIGYKILLFPVLFICIILLIIITPFMMAGCLLRLIFLFIDWINDILDDATIYRYLLDCSVFVNFFIMIFILYGILYCLYLFHRGLNYILGKTITEKFDEDVEMKYTNNFSYKKDDTITDYKEDNNDNIYVINDENYKKIKC
jgi:hypothetical protein